MSIGVRQFDRHISNTIKPNTGTYIIPVYPKRFRRDGIERAIGTGRRSRLGTWLVLKSAASVATASEAWPRLYGTSGFHIFRRSGHQHLQIPKAFS